MTLKFVLINLSAKRCVQNHNPMFGHRSTGLACSVVRSGKWIYQTGCLFQKAGHIVEEVFAE